MLLPLQSIGVEEPMFVLGRHREDVGGLRDPDACGRGARAGRRDVDDHRDPSTTSSFWTIFRIDSASPPGVSSTITSAS